MDNDHNVNKLIKYWIDELLWCYPDATCEASAKQQQTTKQQHPMQTNTNHDSGNDSNASLNKAVAFMFGIDITLLQMLFLVHEKWSTIHVYKIIVFLDEK